MAEVECLHCGACCFSALPRYVDVRGADYERLGELAERFVDFDGVRATLRMQEGHCAALQITVTAGVPRFFCEIYEQRPDVCRELTRGGPACAAERDVKGERALLAADFLVRRRSVSK